MLNSRIEALQHIAHRVADSLESQGDQRVVLVESCTGGMVSAALAGIPGISRFLCGSMVTYRATTKTAWLGISEILLDRFTAESAIVTESLALEILSRTPESHWSVAVTGHLGPGAPVDKDGRIFIAVARQDSVASPALVSSQTIQLESASRRERQPEAATLVLNVLLTAISN